MQIVFVYANHSLAVDATHCQSFGSRGMKREHPHRKSWSQLTVASPHCRSGLPSPIFLLSWALWPTAQTSPALARASCPGNCQCTLNFPKSCALALPINLLTRSAIVEAFRKHVQHIWSQTTGHTCSYNHW